MENIDEDIKLINEIKKEYSTMDGLKEYVQAIENLLSRLKTAERINDVLAEAIIDNHRILEYHHLDEDYQFYRSEIDEVKEWARKKVEDDE